jgi:hypothetical protein
LSPASIDLAGPTQEVVSALGILAEERGRRIYRVSSGRRTSTRPKASWKSTEK